ncbi:MAG: hypothetical protein HY812_20010 [Planctomycetes bacterium]|nr:hypothetical protein [Planctomycetota bacterium]
MPIIACSSCHSRFKVPIAKIGQTLTCPRCKEKFQAVALHSTPRRQHGSGPIVYAAIVVGAVLVAIIIYAIAGRGEPEEAPAPTARSVEEPRPAARPAPEKPRGPSELLAEHARKLLEALCTDDHPMLPLWIDYAEMHRKRVENGIESRPWNELAADERYARQTEYMQNVLGDPETREFLRLATVTRAEVIRLAAGEGKVEATLKNALKDTSQEVVLYFVPSGGTWKLFLLERGPILGAGQAPPEAGAEAGAEATPRPARRTRNPDADVAVVELIAGMPSAITRDIERALAVLCDPAVTTAAHKARQDLIAAGKPAVPHLLNALVPLDLNNESDLRIAALVAGVLADLSGEDFPIVPGANEGSMVGEGAAQNEPNRRRWFGWWRDHKDSYSGPPAPGFEPDEEEEEDEEEAPAEKPRKERQRG